MDTANPDDLLSRRTDHLKIVKQPADGAHVESEPRLFLNRELSWLAFNERVLEEARDPSLPLYERLSRWKREAALRRPDESTGFRVVARKRR